MHRGRRLGVVLIAALVTSVAVGFAGVGLEVRAHGTPAAASSVAAPVSLPSPAASLPVAGPSGDLSPGPAPAVAPSALPAPTPAPTPYHGPMTRVVPVLMYHLIGDPPPGEPYPGLFVSVSDFTAQMQALKDGGWRPITAAELGADIAADRPVPGRSIVLTFDDGNVDNYTAAFPILEAFGFRATFYMVAAGGGRRMTPSELATMARAGMEIANHTLNHRSVSRLSRANLDVQVAGAELRIERELAALGVVTMVRTFAYPAGHVSATAMAYLASRGYTVAFTEGPGVVRIGSTDPLRAPRLRVSRFTTLRGFVDMLPVEPIP